MTEVSDAEQLSNRDLDIVVLRAAGKTVAEIAVELKIGHATVYRRLRLPAVKAALSEIRGQTFRPALDRGASLVLDCIDRLAAILNDPTAHASSRIRAAEAIIGTALKLHEAVDVLPRLAALEAQLGEVAEQSIGN